MATVESEEKRCRQYQRNQKRAGGCFGGRNQFWNSVINNYVTLIVRHTVHDSCRLFQNIKIISTTLQFH